MPRKSIFIVTFLLLTITPCYGQVTGATAQEVNDIINGALGNFFGGGSELPVRDAVTRGETGITAVKTTAMLVDMLIQALGGSLPEDNITPALLARLLQLALQGNTFMFGQAPDAPWNDGHPGYHVFPDGGWIRNEEARYKDSLRTDRELMRILYERQKEWPHEHRQLQEAGMSVHQNEGRNAKLDAIAGLISMGNQQQHMGQLLTMVVGNGQLEQAAREKSERMSERAQERAFVTNFGRPVPMPVFEDVGLLR